MKTPNPLTIHRFSLCAGVFVTFAAASQAASVYINQHSAAVAGGSVVASARLRASNDAWDMALSNGVGYSAVNARRGNLASSFTAPGHTYSFSLNHRAGEGFVFTVRDTATNQTTTQAWGVFATSPGGTVAPTLAGLSPLSPFDAIQIQARSTIAGATTTFSNLVFASPALSVSGGNFSGGALHRNTTIGSNPRGTATQELLADVNLSGYSWTLSGTVNFQRAAGANGANNVSLTVNVRNVAGGAAIPVPEPAGALVAAMVLGASLSRRRRTA